MLILDANLSPHVARLLRATGIEAFHVSELGLGAASDEMVVDHALRMNAIVVTLDADIPRLVMRSQSAGPSVVHLRRTSEANRLEIFRLVASATISNEQQLSDGCIVAVRADRIRVRALPRN